MFKVIYADNHHGEEVAEYAKYTMVVGLTARTLMRTQHLPKLFSE